MTNLRNEWAPSLDVAWRFAACSAAGWVAGWQLYRFNPFAPLIAFLAVGVIAGVGLRAGAAATVGCGITFAIGNVGAFFPLVAVQGMSGDENLFVVMGNSVLYEVG
jgi:hypothetical protein